MTTRFAPAALSLLLAASFASAQTSIPSEFETPSSLLRRAFTYFGGVASASVAHSTSTLFSGNAMQLTINFQPDAIFNTAGVGFQSDAMVRPALNVPAAADTFSLTVDVPPHAAGRLSFFARVREDDNNDGILDTLGDDDQWESPPIILSAGVQVLNIPITAFVDTDEFAGNNVRNFSTTNLMRYFLVFETRTTYPGGMIQVPVVLRADHSGFYVGAQSLPPPPPPACTADFNADGTLDADDLADYINCYFGLPACAAVDFNADGTTNADDLADYINAYFAGC